MRSAFWNAFSAAAYIIVIVGILTYVPQMTGASKRPDTILAPIAMLSLFVLSAAMMGYLFVYQPVLLYFEGQKQESAKLFVHTIGYFAGITAIFLAVAFLVS